MSSETRLSALPDGGRGSVRLLSEDRPALRRRLSALGFTPGAIVTVLRRAPLGDPMQVAVRGGVFALRSTQASAVVLGTDPPAPPQRRVVYAGSRGARLRAAPTAGDLHILLAGSPNCGKTSLFNALTGSHRRVGNLPGVTVEAAFGETVFRGRRLHITDLPGIYSLTAAEAEERAALDYLMNGKYDLIINIVDGTSLERGLFLTTQLAEPGRPMIAALNFLDEMRRERSVPDVSALGAALGLTLVAVSARTGEGIDGLLAAALTAEPCTLPFSAPSDAERYALISRALSSAAVKPAGGDRSEGLDRLLLGRFSALPVFILVMLAVFAFTFGAPGAWLGETARSIILSVGGIISAALSVLAVPPWLEGAAAAIVAGIGGVLAYLPQIALLFFLTSLLEDSGYMARAAFLSDRLMRPFGLSGKAFVPLFTGFGCTIPALLSTRTLESEDDRRLAAMLLPFMSCSAKMPLYGLIAAAFFGRRAWIAVFSMYALGILMAIVSGLLLKGSVLAGGGSCFLLEMPPYRAPSLKSALTNTWQSVKGFLKKAGTLIPALSLLLWFLQGFSPALEPVTAPEASILASFGRFIAPLFAPLGFGSWRAAVALLSGLAAKEAIVSSLSLLGGFSSDLGFDAVRSLFGSASTAAAFMVFVLLYIPCFAALVTMIKERGIKFAAFSSVWQLCTAYIVSWLVKTALSIFGI